MRKNLLRVLLLLLFMASAGKSIPMSSSSPQDGGEVSSSNNPCNSRDCIWARLVALGLVRGGRQRAPPVNGGTNGEEGGDARAFYPSRQQLHQQQHLYQRQQQQQDLRQQQRQVPRGRGRFSADCWSNDRTVDGEEAKKNDCLWTKYPDEKEEEMVEENEEANKSKGTAPNK